MDAKGQALEQWAIVEIFGHQKIAGRVSEQTIGGCSFVRVDVPDLPERVIDDYGTKRTQPPMAGFTKLYGNGAIYAISFVDEDIATAAAASLRERPVDAYTLSDAIKSAKPEALRRLAAPDEEDDDVPL